MAQTLGHIANNLNVENDLRPSLFNRAGRTLINGITANYNVTFFKGEENFDSMTTLKWYKDNRDTTFYWVAAYLIVIFGGRHLMKTRERFTLQRPLVLWNFGLALFSIMGAMRVIPELIHVLFNEPDGFYHSVCVDSFFENKAFGYWNMLFGFSKVVELGDTVFIILRKQQLIFLHWYHHVTVLVFTWFAGADAAAMGRWFSSVNLLIHSFMYTYYWLKAMKVKIPKPIAIAITSSQLLQMVVGVTVVLSARSYKNNGLRCAGSNVTIFFALGIYASYCALFANFFYKAYLAPKSKNVKSKAGADGAVTAKKLK